MCVMVGGGGLGGDQNEFGAKKRRKKALTVTGNMKAKCIVGVQQNVWRLVRKRNMEDEAQRVHLKVPRRSRLLGTSVTHYVEAFHRWATAAFFFLAFFLFFFPSLAHRDIVGNANKKQR